jgi:hypothetical protein
VPEPAADVEAARLLGHASRTTDLLHVSSTIARKRIDVLLTIVASVRKQRHDVPLVRVGGPFTADQRRLARELEIEDAIVVLPFSTVHARGRLPALRPCFLPSEQGRPAGAGSAGVRRAHRRNDIDAARVGGPPDYAHRRIRRGRAPWCGSAERATISVRRAGRRGIGAHRVVQLVALRPTSSRCIAAWPPPCRTAAAR